MRDIKLCMSPLQTFMDVYSETRLNVDIDFVIGLGNGGVSLGVGWGGIGWN